ncbi:MAG: hypothetical protein ABI658_24605, partial [Acidimicrobiales bacterium]
MGNRGDRPSGREEPALIELVMLDPGPRPSAAPLARSRRPHGPRPSVRRRWPLVAFAAVIAVAIVAIVARSGGDGEPAAAPVTTTAPSPSVTVVSAIPTTTIPTTTIPTTTIPTTTI